MTCKYKSVSVGIRKCVLRINYAVFFITGMCITRLLPLSPSFTLSLSLILLCFHLRYFICNETVQLCIVYAPRYRVIKRAYQSDMFRAGTGRADVVRLKEREYLLPISGGTNHILDCSVSRFADLQRTDPMDILADFIFRILTPRAR